MLRDKQKLGYMTLSLFLYSTTRSLHLPHLPHLSQQLSQLPPSLHLRMILVRLSLKERLYLYFINKLLNLIFHLISNKLGLLRIRGRSFSTTGRLNSLPVWLLNRLSPRQVHVTKTGSRCFVARSVRLQ
jgi:hypothetical protein